MPPGHSPLAVIAQSLPVPVHACSLRPYVWPGSNFLFIVWLNVPDIAVNDLPVVIRTACIAICVHALLVQSNPPVSKSSTIPTKILGSILGAAILKPIKFTQDFVLELFFGNSFRIMQSKNFSPKFLRPLSRLSRFESIPRK